MCRNRSKYNVSRNCGYVNTKKLTGSEHNTHSSVQHNNKMNQTFDRAYLHSNARHLDFSAIANCMSSTHFSCGTFNLVVPNYTPKLFRVVRHYHGRLEDLE